MRARKLTRPLCWAPCLVWVSLPGAITTRPRKCAPFRSCCASIRIGEFLGPKLFRPLHPLNATGSIFCSRCVKGTGHASKISVLSAIRRSAVQHCRIRCNWIPATGCRGTPNPMFIPRTSSTRIWMPYAGFITIVVTWRSRLTPSRRTLPQTSVT